MGADNPNGINQSAEKHLKRLPAPGHRPGLSFTERKGGSSYLRPMDRDAWLMAASLLDQHGKEAAAIICAQIAVLHRVVEAMPNAEDAALLRFWVETGEALLAIVNAKPAGAQRVN
jgi:hypothetical protein